MQVSANPTASGPARPPVKWAGGKRRLLPEIFRCVPSSFLQGVASNTANYYEPFAGGAALFFALPRVSAVLGDANGKLINTYKAIRDDVAGVIAHLMKHPNDKAHYYAVRARNFNVGSAAERAAEFLFTNRVGYNGLYRENKAGEFNVPYGDNANATVCDSDNLRAASAALQGVSIVRGDFADTVSDAAPGDFVYFDPPYAPLSATSTFTGYVSHGFTAHDQVRLRDVAVELKQRGVSLLISNSSAPLIRELYAVGFEVHEVKAPRSINSKVSGRGAVTELLIT
jgi:DNA adenine methylase